MDIDHELESKMRKEEVLGTHRPEHFRVKHSDIHKIAEELRMEGKGSHDPCYENSKKNK